MAVRNDVPTDSENLKEEVEEEITHECHCCPDVNRNLLPPKLFYFFFFAANGTLLPYLVLFFKQLGLKPNQVGIVTGLKPFISFIFTPIWGYIADKTNKTKWIFLLSLMAYIGGYFAYSFAPAKHVCKLRTNSTKHYQPLMIHHIHRRDVLGHFAPYNSLPDTSLSKNNDGKMIQKRKSFDNYFRKPMITKSNYSTLTVKGDIKKTSIQHTIDPGDFVGEDTPLSISLFELPQRFQTQEKLKDKMSSLRDESNKSVHKPSMRDENVNSNNIDFLDLDINENTLDFFQPTWRSDLKFHSSPWTISAAAKANSGDEGIGFSEDISSYVDVRSIFSYLLIVTVTATIFSCALITIVDTATIRKLKETNETHKYGRQRLWGSLGWGLSSFGVGSIISMLPLCSGMNNEVNYYPAFYVFAILLLIALVIGLKLNFSPPEQTAPSDHEHHSTRAENIEEGLKLLKSPVYCCFIFTSFYIGIVMSIIRTFLFWHLKDIGGSQLLFSIVAAVNCSAEVFVYYFSSAFIKKVGHIKVLYISLVCYSLRLYYYGLLKRPWYVLAAEPLSGITTAAAWAAMTSFVGLKASPESVTTLQGILHGIHWGLGHGCGELIGGYMVSWIGAAMTFNVFGTLTWVQLLIFMFVSWLSDRKRDKMEENNDENVYEDSLAPKQCCD